MKPKLYYFYTIKDKFFTDYPDDNLKHNKNQKRPFYVCVKDNNGLFWVIPCTSQCEKYNDMIERARENNRPLDKWHKIQVGGINNILLIQDIFPIKEEYIEKEFVKNSVHQRIASTIEQKTITKKANRIIAIRRYKGKLFDGQADILKIEAGLLSNKK